MECFSVCFTAKSTRSELFPEVKYPDDLVSQIEVEVIPIAKCLGGYVATLEFCYSTAYQHISTVLNITKCQHYFLVILRYTVLPIVMPIRHIITARPRVFTNTFRIMCKMRAAISVSFLRETLTAVRAVAFLFDYSVFNMDAIKILIYRNNHAMPSFPAFCR